MNKEEKIKEMLRIDAPLYIGSENILRASLSEQVTIVAYSGYPNSSLNGGRGQWYSTFVDGKNKKTEEQTQKNREVFEQEVNRINKEGVPFFLTYTNLLYTDEELEDPDNLEPIRILIDNYMRYGVKNGVVFANHGIHSWVKGRSSGLLDTVCSCTAFFREKPIPDEERLRMYRESATEYDLVILTPQDSVRPEILKSIKSKEKFYAIVNSLCSIDCNSYWHYFHISVENKKVLGSERFLKWYKDAQDKAARFKGCPFDIEQGDLEMNVKMMHNVGIRNFKIGRQDPIQDKKYLSSLMPILRKISPKEVIMAG